MVFQSTLTARGRVQEGSPSDWGAQYWTGDFTRVNRPGKFRIKIRMGSEELPWFPFQIGKQALFRQTAMLPATWTMRGYLRRWAVATGT